MAPPRKPSNCDFPIGRQKRHGVDVGPMAIATWMLRWITRRRIAIVISTVTCFYSLIILINEPISYTDAEIPRDIAEHTYTGFEANERVWVTWSFEEALFLQAGPQKVIILAMVDGSVTDPVINFYQNSILPHNISNILFVSVSKHGCDILLKFHIPCVTYGDVNDEASEFRSKDFLAKMNMRTNYTRHALQLGFTVLQTDTDVVFLQNPLPYFTCSSCHLEALQDGQNGYVNAGFVLIRANGFTLNLYKEMWTKAQTDPMSEDQGNMNKIIKTKKMKYRVLNPQKFICGVDYYEIPKRYFRDTAIPCTGCVVVHNNWIVSTAAKIYRFKEMGQWQFDKNGYYSNPTAKYLTYTSPRMGKFQGIVRSSLVNALALATLLNRTLILPKFYCPDDKTHCPLNSLIYIKYFDEHFDYREHVFLQHARVPTVIKDTLNVSINPTSGAEKWRHSTDFYFSSDRQLGATEGEILQWFSSIDTPVIDFGNLSNSFAGFASKEAQDHFDKRITAGVRKAGYRQF